MLWRDDEELKHKREYEFELTPMIICDHPPYTDHCIGTRNAVLVNEKTMAEV